MILSPTHPDGPRRLPEVRCSDCDHLTAWHVGGLTPAPGCDCCSWRKNEPNGRWITGPLGLPMWQVDDHA